MKFKELKTLPSAELKDKLTELRKELMKENAQIAIGTVPKNPRKVRNAKKTIAKIEMLLARPASKPVQQPASKVPSSQVNPKGVSSQK